MKILLQTTIPTTEDDWSIARFGLLAEFLSRQTAADGSQITVSTRDRSPLGTEDPVLSTLDGSDFDQLWLFAVDTGQGLTPRECAAIDRFRQARRGVLVTRDHMDLGSCICNLAEIGKAHHFHTRNIDPDTSRCAIDDPYTTEILWPNFHSGANGDYQHVEIVEPIHPLLKNPDSATGTIRFLPSHPHEGDVAAPPGSAARVVARGRSKVTGRPFNLAVVFEGTGGAGRAIAQSTFHHFADYNWDITKGKPSFVSEAPGSGMRHTPEALADTHCYVRNAVRWLSIPTA